MLSIPHLIIIFLVALVVFGPEKLPELARNFGKIMAEFRRATGDLRSTFEDHMRDLEREADDRRIGSGRLPAAPPVQGASGSAPPDVVPTTPLSSRGAPEFSNVPADGSSEASRRDGSAPHESNGGESFAHDAAPPSAESVPDPAASLPTSPHAAQAPENDNKHETVGDGHSSS